MLRSILELLVRDRIIKRRLPARFGRTPLYVSPDSRLRYLLPGEKAFDRGLLQIVQEHIRVNSIVWDIGANLGLFAFGAATVARNGEVLAVEADAWLAQLISKSLQLKQNRNLRMQILPCAISDKCGVARFMIAQRGRSSNALQTAVGRSQSDGSRKTVIVPTSTLDSLLDAFAPPSFVKIDVEGAEAMALRGAGRILSEVRPTFFVEVGREANEEVTSIFQSARYLLFDGAIPVQQRQPRNSCAFDTLAKPIENCV
jgi:FkbM family methyltransferase